MTEATLQQFAEPPVVGSRATLAGVRGVVMELFPEGALWWGDMRLLVVADLHLEKGSSFARRGQLVPPYDTAETLARLARLIARLRPRIVVALGDSFHDPEGATRLSASHRAMLKGLQLGREWVWIAGNHDPERPPDVGGEAMDELGVGRILFRHAPSAGPTPGEVAGHLHPCARVRGGGKSVRRRCFAGDGERLVLPAFGAYAGGLDVLTGAVIDLFVPENFRAFMLGDERIYTVGMKALSG
jgi:DNA ligase-associated metallophosphoesterase